MAFQETNFQGEGVTLKGWVFRATPNRRGALIYLHGIADCRESGIGIAERFAPQGFDVVAYDSRAHGDSGGTACTYGYYEKRDLSRVIDQLHADRVALIGVSLGGAVALQAAEEDPRIAAVVAVSTFSDLRTVATERAPFIASRANIEGAFQLAERQAKFRIADVSPLKAAPHIHVPVLLVHGTKDSRTPPAHSQRVYDALGGSKRLILVDGAGHDDVLNQKTWKEVDDWLGVVLPESSVPVRRP